MSNTGGLNFTFEIENIRPLPGRGQLLAWSERVFAEPHLQGQAFDVRSFNPQQLNLRQEMQLYNDFQIRDSELGMGLVDWRKSDLAQSISLVRSAVAKRYLTVSLTSTRIDAIDKINQGELNPNLRYSPNIIQELRQERGQALRELAYLRRRISQMHALEHLLRVVYLENSQTGTRNTEQLLRLLSQGWRGLLRIQAWSEQFRPAHSDQINHFTSFTFNREIQGYLLELGEKVKPIIISHKTLSYLLHLLESIQALAEASMEIMQNGQALQDHKAWYPICTLLRAIVEFFHFCNFEIPLFYLDVAIDIDDPAHLYRKQGSEWQTIGDDKSISSSYALKRVATEAAFLLVEASPLLECTDMEKLDRFLKTETTNHPLPLEAEERDVQPFSNCGLSEFDLDPSTQRIKFRIAFPLMSTLLNLLVANQSSLRLLQSSPLGGPLDTLLGMALLDSRAFSLPEDNNHPLDRFQVISHFWRAVGRRRAIGMLGEEYVNRVTAGLQALGQPSPEHPTFLTLKLPALAAEQTRPTTLPGATEDSESNVLPGLVMADHIAIMDLINITWALADDCMLSLREMNTEDDLEGVVQRLPRLVDSYRNEIMRRFSEKWLASTNWTWSMIRGLSPMLWDFWIKIGTENPWDDMVSRAPASTALVLLLRLFCDTTRLVLLLDLSGSSIANGLRVNAEAASQMIMIALERFFIGPNAPAIITESIDSYFDPHMRFDSWLAFVSSTKTFLQRCIAELKNSEAATGHCKLLEYVLEELERLYPKRVVAGTLPTPTPSTKNYTPDFVEEAAKPVTPPVLRLINETDAAAFYKICFEMLGSTEQDVGLFLRLLSMFRRIESNDWIYTGVRYKTLIEQLLPEYRYRRLLYSLPNRTASFFQLLAKLSDEGRTSPDNIETMRPEVMSYFEQLNEVYITTLARFNNYPQLLPQENVAALTACLNGNGRDKSLSYPLLLLLVCDHPLIYFDNFDNEKENYQSELIDRIRNEVVEKFDKQTEDPLIEIFPLGSAKIGVVEGRACIYSGNPIWEPAFTEPDKPISRLLIAKFLSNKFAMVLDIMRAQFPQQVLIVQP